VILNSEDHEHFINHGYVIVRNAVPPGILAAAVNALEQNPGAHGRGLPEIEACTTERMLDAIEELFGDGYAFHRRPGGYDMPRPHQPEEPWPEPTAHVDDSYPTMMPNGWAIGSFIFLTPVLSHGGAFIYFPGSYLRYREVMGHCCHCIKGAAQQPVYSGPYREYLAAAGDVLLFHHLMGHTGSTNVRNPATRHAILCRWHPVERIIPGDKPTDQMTTIEKTNSARYMADRFNLELPILHPPHLTESLDGVAPWNQVVTFAILHYGGRLHLFYVDSDAPCTIRCMTSRDITTWEESEPLTPDLGDIRSIQFHQYRTEAILGVTAVDGHSAIFESTDMISWDPQAVIADCHAATPWFVYGQYPSKVAEGQAIYRVPVSETDKVYCHWGDRWNEANSWDTTSCALQTPNGERIQDLTIAAHVGDSFCTIVVDVASDRADITVPLYTQPTDVAVANEPLRPLPFACDTAPRQIRIINRARKYWLVTYLRAHAGQERMFFGCIDWNREEPVLEELSTGRLLRQALGTVGFV